MVLQVPAMMAVIGYFVIVVYAGVRFGRKTHVFKDAFQLSHIQEQQKLFGTDSHLSLLLAICSMTAAWVGGGYLNGTAEAVYMRGLLYCHAPIGYAISLVIGGIFFAEKMRTANAVTMLDPFQAQYGRWMGLLLCLPAVCGELLWTAAMFSALGYTADVIMGIDASLFIVVASTAIFIYTALGGYYSITYTDALQIGSTAACLWSCVPFVVTNPGIGTVGPPQNDWSGSTALGNIGQTFDVFLMTSLGGIPWQVYFQRVLGCKNDFNAKMISFVAAIGSFAMAVPAAVIGATAKTTNLTALGYAGPWPLSDGDGARVLPLAIQYLAPGSVSVLGLVGVTAAVMSSADSSMLSASAMITRNIYHAICRPQAGEPEVAVMLRLVVCIAGAGATYLALSVRSVYGLWTLCSDLVYVLLFPQLVAVLYFKHTNAYGSFIAFVVGGISRWLCGDRSVNLPELVRLPLHDQQSGQRFPIRLACMALGLATLVLVSLLSATAFENGWLPPSLDFFGCFNAKSPTRNVAERPQRDNVETSDATSSKADVGFERNRKASADAQMSAAESKSQRSLRSSMDAGGALTDTAFERRRKSGLDSPTLEKNTQRRSSLRRGSGVTASEFETERRRKSDMNPSGAGSSRKPSTSAYTTVADTTSKRFDASKLRASVDWGKTTLHTATESGAPSKGRSSEKKRKSQKAGEESTRSMRSSRSGAKGRKASTGSYWKFWQRNASVDKGKEKAKAGFDASKLKASMDWGKSTVYSAAESMGPSKGPSSDKKGKPKKAADEATRSVRSSRSGAKVRKADTSSSKTNGKRLTREPSKSATAPQRVDL